MLDFNNWRSIRQLAEEAEQAAKQISANASPLFTEAKLRWLVSKANEYGLESVIIKVGGRIYFDREGFNTWLESRKLSNIE